MNIYQPRSKVVIFFVYFVTVILILRLFYLQVIEKKYKQFARNNALQRRIVYPARGIIYDRNGKILVSNQVVYDLMVIPNQVKELDTNDLCEILDISKDDFDSILDNIRSYSRYKSSVFYKNISVAMYGRLEERLFEFRGFYVQPRTTRKYLFSMASHILGYLSEASEKDIERSGGYYHNGDYIGISGLEEAYEKELRGENGEKYILVDVHNTEQGSYSDGSMDKQSISGQDLITTLNYDLQEYAQKLMKGKRGGVVAIIPSTGEVLVMVSSPSYDPTLLVGRERARNYANLLLDEDKPLFNRAIAAMYPPGSTFKVVQALIGLQEGTLTPGTTYACHRGYILPGLKIGCHEHPSPLDLHGSIVNSCNAYYCNVFRALIDMKKFNSPMEGYINWYNDVKMFGIGSKLGLDIPNEVSGILPTYHRYDKIYGVGAWKSSNILSLAIGQAEISLTPLQLANVASIIANRGYYYEPHLIKSFVKEGNKINHENKKHLVKINNNYYEIVIDAMNDVVNFGTGVTARLDSMSICGKTGTAQNPHGKEHSLFIAFAPRNNPKIAIAVVVENAGFGATWAAPISSLLIEKYLYDSVSTKRKWIENRVLEFKNGN